MTKRITSDASDVYYLLNVNHMPIKQKKKKSFSIIRSDFQQAWHGMALA